MFNCTPQRRAARRVLILTVCLAGVLTGCLEKKPRSFFASDGIGIGTPKKEGNVYRVPVTFTTTIVHSEQWIYVVETSTDGNTIYLTAIFTTPPGLKESRYKDVIEVHDAKAGVYHLRYRDPDGSLHDSGTVTLP